jgi:CheY-like chemotaxis protein
MLPGECARQDSVITTLLEAERNKEPFDLIIVERSMSDMDCFEVASQIRQSSIDVAILMTTLDNVPGEHTRALQLGIDGYAVRPISRCDMLRLVCKILGSVHNPKGEQIAALDVVADQPGDGRTLRILIADDSDDNRFLLREYLKNSSYEIAFAENGEQALQMARSEPFDLVLMDIQMPLMDGLTATRLMRKAEQEEGRNPVPVLALTASARKEDIEASLVAGCNAHITKPLSREKLLTGIEAYVKRSGEPTVVYPLQIDLPAGLEEAAKRYIKARKDEVPRLFGLVAERKFGELRALAHNMKGTGTSYGFPELTRRGGVIEHLAGEQDTEALSRQLLALSQYVQDAENAVNALAL